MTDVILVRNDEITMGQVVDTIRKLQIEHPEYEVFLDGDARAIVGRCRA